MDAKKELELLREFKNFVTDICFDYQCHDPRNQADIGLSAIRVLAKGKQSEEEFEKVWRKWCDSKSVTRGEDEYYGLEEPEGESG